MSDDDQKLRDEQMRLFKHCHELIRSKYGYPDMPDGDILPYVKGRGVTEPAGSAADADDVYFCDWPQSSDTRYQNMISLADTLVSRTLYSDARKVLQRCSTAFRDDAFAVYKLSECYQRLGMTEAYQGLLWYATNLPGFVFGPAFSWAKAIFPAGNLQVESLSRIYLALGRQALRGHAGEQALDLFMKSLATSGDMLDERLLEIAGYCVEVPVLPAVPVIDKWDEAGASYAGVPWESLREPFILARAGASAVSDAGDDRQAAVPVSSIVKFSAPVKSLYQWVWDRFVANGILTEQELRDGLPITSEEYDAFAGGSADITEDTFASLSLMTDISMGMLEKINARYAASL